MGREVRLGSAAVTDFSNNLPTPNLPTPPLTVDNMIINSLPSFRGQEGWHPGGGRGGLRGRGGPGLHGVHDREEDPCGRNTRA